MAGMWAKQVQHDLVKRLTWRARDLREVGVTDRAAALAELGRSFAELTDEEGTAIDASALWLQLRAAAPASVSVDALNHFGESIHAAVRAVAGADFEAAMTAVLAIDDAFDVLKRGAK